MPTDDSSCCSNVADVICNRQAKFIVELREIRPTVEQCHVSLLCFKAELERRQVTSEDLTRVVLRNKLCYEALEHILANNVLNITSGERLGLRQIKEELYLLNNYIEDIKHEELIEPSAQLSRLLMGKVSSAGENMREYMRWTDEKTARRWWLTDFIQFLQIFLKLALFISAAVSVVYHYEQSAPIVTLGLTVLQGVVELLDQFFVKKISPKQIKLSLISVKPSSEA
uniref:Uncharacterized protein n=1 Tax=Plectus sambesii TaxID=2011161 RepID=A0A914WZT2_9BILA